MSINRGSTGSTTLPLVLLTLTSARLTNPAIFEVSGLLSLATLSALGDIPALRNQ